MKFCGILWDNGGSCETWLGWFQRKKTRDERDGWGGGVRREKMAVGVMRRTVIGQGDMEEEESPKLEGRKRGRERE